MNKKKTPKNHQEGQSKPEPYFTGEKVGDLADQWFKEWEPYLNTEGERLLGEVVCVLLAQVGQLQEGFSIQSGSLSQANDLLLELTARHRASTKSISARLEKGGL